MKKNKTDIALLTVCCLCTIVGTMLGHVALVVLGLMGLVGLALIEGDI